MTDTEVEDGDYYIDENAASGVRTSVEKFKGEFVNESVHQIGAPRLADLWHNFTVLPSFMPLFKVLVWRSISLRYTQSFLGVLWVAIQPVASTVMVTGSA